MYDMLNHCRHIAEFVYGLGQNQRHCKAILCRCSLLNIQLASNFVALNNVYTVSQKSPFLNHSSMHYH